MVYRLRHHFLSGLSILFMTPLPLVVASGGLTLFPFWVLGMSAALSGRGTWFPTQPSLVGLFSF